MLYMRFISLITGLLFVIVQTASADVRIRQTILLTNEEQSHLMLLIQKHKEAQKYWEQIQEEAQSVLNDRPHPLKVIHYEGLLDTDPKRVKTEQSLRDMDKLAVLLFAFYGTKDKIFAEKARVFILAWINAYKATGNPINENKFEPLIHSYHVMRDYFSQTEKDHVNLWMTQIAEAEMARDNIPENNWKAKHIKLVGTIGLILQKQEYIQYAIAQYKKYVDAALYADGTSRDLHQRDALSYHVSGLDPLLTFAITLEQFEGNAQLDAFRYENPKGGSVKKSVDYVIPFAKGEKEYAEWVNTKVELDKQRARAGLEHYQPGKLFEPERALETFELASYFDRTYFDVIQTLEEDFQEYSSWFFLLICVAGEIS